MLKAGSFHWVGVSLLACLMAGTALAEQIDVDYDFMLWAIDSTLDEMAPGQFGHMYGQDRDGNGLPEQDHLGMLSAVLLNNSPELSLTVVYAVQDGFKANMAQMARDLVFNVNVLGQSFHIDVLSELRKEDPLFAVAVQYFLAGYMTCGDSVTFNFVNSLLKSLVTYFAEREGYGWVLDYVSLSDYINFGPSRYVTFGDTGTNYLGANGNVDGDGQTNIQEYAGSGTREVWFTRCKIAPPPRIAANPNGGSCQTGDAFTLTAGIVGGSGTLNYQWLRTDSNGKSFPSSYDYVGPNAPTYPISYVTALDKARFSIAVSDSASIFNPSTRMGGRQSWGARLNAAQVALQITAQPVGNNLNVGETFNLEFRVKGGAVAPTYQWTHNGVIAGPNSGTWVIAPVSGSSQGVYQCTATSGGEQVTSVTVNLNVFGAGTVVHFEDPNLEAAVRHRLGFDEVKDIYEGDLVAITDLDASSRGITNLTGIEKLFNLSDLNLWNNQLADVSPLANLFSLQTLNLALNQISDLAELANLEQLHHLFLWDNQLVDITQLLANDGFDAGDEIGLEGNPLSELALCQTIPELEARGVFVGYDGVCPLAEGEGLPEGDEEGLLEGEGTPEGTPDGEGQNEGIAEGEGEGQVFGDCDIDVHTTHFSAMLDPGNTLLPLNVPVSKIIENVEVRLDVTHPADNQLRAQLTSPQGTDVFLFLELQPGANLTNTVFSDQATTPITGGVPPYTGVYAPQMPLSFLNGQNMQGLWILKLVDIAEGDAGRVNSWGLFFNRCPQEGSQDGEGVSEGEGVADGEGLSEGEGTVDGEGSTEGQALPFHSADVNQNWDISLTELMRVIQFFNLKAYSCGTGTEDGYKPGSGPHACAYHDSDYAPSDWSISLTELLRLIQFFNLSSGLYHVDPDSEDGFAPGAAS